MDLSRYKPAGIPFVVTAYGAFIAIIGMVLGISGLIDPTSAVGYVEGADVIAGAWAGRTLGLGLALALALWFKTAQAYVIVFLASVCREGGDIVGAVNQGGTGTIPMLAAFIVLDVICLVLSVRALLHRTPA